MSFVSQLLNLRRLFTVSDIKKKIFALKNICFNVYNFNVQYFQDQLWIVPNFYF